MSAVHLTADGHRVGRPPNATADDATVLRARTYAMSMTVDQVHRRLQFEGVSIARDTLTAWLNGTARDSAGWPDAREVIADLHRKRERARLLFKRGWSALEVIEHMADEGRFVTLDEVMRWIHETDEA